MICSKRLTLVDDGRIKSVRNHNKKFFLTTQLISGNVMNKLLIKNRPQKGNSSWNDGL